MGLKPKKRIEPPRYIHRYGGPDGTHIDSVRDTTNLYGRVSNLGEKGTLIYIDAGLGYTLYVLNSSGRHEPEFKKTGVHQGFIKTDTAKLNHSSEVINPIQEATANFKTPPVVKNSTVTYNKDIVQNSPNVFEKAIDKTRDQLENPTQLGDQITDEISNVGEHLLDGAKKGVLKNINGNTNEGKLIKQVANLERGTVNRIVNNTLDVIPDRKFAKTAKEAVNFGKKALEKGAVGAVVDEGLERAFRKPLQKVGEFVVDLVPKSIVNKVTSPALKLAQRALKVTRTASRFNPILTALQLGGDAALYSMEVVEEFDNSYSLFRDLHPEMSEEEHEKQKTHIKDQAYKHGRDMDDVALIYGSLAQHTEFKGKYMDNMVSEISDFANATDTDFLETANGVVNILRLLGKTNGTEQDISDIRKIFQSSAKTASMTDLDFNEIAQLQFSYITDARTNQGQDIDTFNQVFTAVNSYTDDESLAAENTKLIFDQIFSSQGQAALSKMGIKIKDSQSGRFKQVDDILREMSDKFKNMRQYEFKKTIKQFDKYGELKEFYQGLRMKSDIESNLDEYEKEGEYDIDENIDENDGVIKWIREKYNRADNVIGTGGQHLIDGIKEAKDYFEELIYGPSTTPNSSESEDSLVPKEQGGKKRIKESINTNPLDSSSPSPLYKIQTGKSKKFISYPNEGYNSDSLDLNIGNQTLSAAPINPMPPPQNTNFTIKNKISMETPELSERESKEKFRAHLLDAVQELKQQADREGRYA